MIEEARNAVPDRLETPRLVLRAWRPGDAPLLKAAIDASLAELRPYMAWAWNEPSTLERFVERLERYAAEFRDGIDWRFGLFPPDEREVLGAVGMHRRSASPGTRDFGYWLRSDAVGRGYMTEAVGALTDLALGALGAERVEIRCDARNVRSAGVPRRLGYRMVRAFEEEYAGAVRTTQLWERRGGGDARQP